MKRSLSVRKRPIGGTPMPTGIQPMLCTLIREPFTNDRYIFEVKWDGYRIICYKEGTHVTLSSRGGENYTAKYPPLKKALLQISSDCVLDGEAVVLNDEGKPDFDALQKFNGQSSGMVYYAFDILWLDGRNLTDLAVLERKEILRCLLDGNDIIKFSEHFDDGLRLFEQVRELGLEGIVAKDKTSKYIPNDRSKLWYKIPTVNRGEFVIGGWVESEKRHFRTLLFGVYKGKRLEWVGHAGGGFKEREMKVILDQLKKIETGKNPFSTTVDYDGIAHWVKPKLVANIRYATLTKGGRIRKPAIFEGFRNDKQAQQVAVEKTAPTPKSTRKKTIDSGNNAIVKRTLPTSEKSYWRTVESEIIGSENVLDVDGCPVTFYNLEREVWKNVSKYDLIQYYISVSKYILPHISKRPLSLHLKPFGPRVEGGYIKDMERREPACSEIFSVPRKHKVAGKRDIIDYLVCNNLPTLLYIINLNCIDVNPWTTTVEKIDKPDYIVIDLDPSGEDFSKVVQVARAAQDLFLRKKIKAFVKTSGKTGMHLYLPCSAFKFKDARLIAENIANEIHGMVSSITTLNVSTNGRGNNVYIDPNQNDYADTVAAPYSVRPNKNPTVSTPLDWREVRDSLTPEKFTIHTIQKRLEKKGDLFESVTDLKIAQANDKRLIQFL